MDEGLRILVVDDTRTNLALLEAMLKKMGHRPILASDAIQGLALFKEQLPDLVLLDVMMPVMDGYQAAQEIRRITNSWVPIIFISAMNQVDDMVKGLQAGGDDYLFKPVNYEVLRAKINILIERMQMSRILADQNRILMDHRARAEEEQQTAQDFMNKLTALDEIDDPAVRFYLHAADNFSGDLIAVARTPANQLHILLADSTGHGLTAALAVTPVLQPFHAMSAKGFSIAAIAAEINRKVKEYLPIHRYVAAILLSVDGANRTISVWNGGCPPVVVLNEEGLAVWQFDSSHVPLGIFEPHEFDAKLDHFRIGDTAKNQVVLCSDGAMDALNHTDMEASMKLLLQSARKAERDTRFADMVSFIEQKESEVPEHDDIALIMVDCEKLVVTEPEVKQREVKPDIALAELEEGSDTYCDACGWRFSLALTAPQLREVDVVPMLLNLVNQVETEEKQISGHLFMVLSELFNNALDHGLLKLDSKLKHDPEGMERYFEERSARLSKLTKGEIHLEIERKCCPQDYLIVRLKDDGEGFDHSTKLDDAESISEHRHGRGILLVKNMCSSLQYLGNGSEVVAHLAL